MSAIPWQLIWPILTGVAKDVLSIALVHRWVENVLLQRVPTDWDRVVWQLVCKYLAVKEPPPEQVAALKADLDRVQDTYNEVKRMAAAGGTMSHESIRAAMMARGLVLGQDFEDDSGATPV